MLDVSRYPPIAWPRVLRIRQPLPGPPEIDDLDQAVEEAVAASGQRIRPGGAYALGVGSRGIGRIGDITRALIRALERRGARAFIIPAMGSHGGATPAGQADVLATFGITEQTMGVPILTSMRAEPVAEIEPGLVAYTSVEALAADGVIPIARIKPHTAFHGPIESGICKMLVIGFGKHRGALSAHAAGFSRFHEIIPRLARSVLDHVYMPFGLGILENGHDRPARIVALPPDDLEAEEARLLEVARAWMARLPFDQMDVLLIGELGKNISGDGMDPNVTGRYSVRDVTGGPVVQKIVVFSLTPETHGNAMGIGQADTITRRCYRQIDLVKTYTNSITSTELAPARIPVILNSDRDALDIALRTINGARPEQARLVAIRNTLQLEEFVISESLWPEAQRLGCVQLSTPEAIGWQPDSSIPSIAGLQLYAEDIPEADETAAQQLNQEDKEVPPGGVEHDVERIPAEAVGGADER